MFRKRLGLFIAVFVLLSGLAFAQDSTGTTGDRNSQYQMDQQNQNDQSGQSGTQAFKASVDDLKTRLNLTDTQVSQINGILSRYQRESSTSLQNDTPETMNNSRQELQKRYAAEIEGVLDENQKSQWRSYSDTWFSTLNIKNGTGTEKQYQNQEDQQNQNDQQNNSDTDKR